MSADLFAEFGAGPPQTAESSKPEPVKVQAAPAFSFFDDLNSTTPAPVTQSQHQAQTLQWGQPTQSYQVSAPTTEEDDDWGDFEGGSSSQPAFVREDAISAPSVPTSQPSQISWQPAPVYKAKKSYDSNVLFDAEEDGQDDDDDFGDFEEPESASSAPAPASSGVTDLLGDLSLSRPLGSSPKVEQVFEGQRNKVASPPTKGHHAGGFGAMSKQAPKSTPRGADQQEEAWDSFDDWEASIPAKAEAKPRQTTGSTTMDALQSASNPINSRTQPEEGLPPTNIPPPAVVLSLFPSIFAAAQEKLFKPMLSQALPMRNKLASDPGTITYLQAYLELISVAARIIAGRKLRWKRDAHLSQGMRIGPASSRATSGMKLAGIDKTENMKEEREVADVVRAWREQVGKLRHVVSAANQAKSGSLGRGVDLAENMPVRTLKQAEGGVPARQPCMLCGLKRDERVAAENQNVEDSFGEWWIDQTSMHRGRSYSSYLSIR